EAEAPKRRWFHVAPAWGLAAAAMLLAAIGAAIANLDIRYGSEGLVVRTGWNHIDAAPQSVVSNVTPVDWKTQADQLDRRLRELERTISTHQSPVQNASASDLSDADLLQRVRDIVGQSETRQQRVVASRLNDLMREFDAQRRLDLASIDQGMTRLQNSSGMTKDLVQRLLVRTAYDAK
ncbi:MAG: hypothetical protein ACJ731_13635, partial [Vicinamibacterales bacterium]